MLRNPCFFDGTDSHSAQILLLPRFSFAFAPFLLTEKLLRKSNACVPVLSFESRRSIGGLLSPVYFRGLEPWRVSCYAFFKGWLLLSLPPRCLWFMTPFQTISRHLRTLTSVSFVSVSWEQLTHPHCFLFLVLASSELEKTPYPEGSARQIRRFTLQAEQIRLYFGIFPQEPDISELDWLFAPKPQVIKTHVHRTCSDLHPPLGRLHPAQG